MWNAQGVLVWRTYANLCMQAKNYLRLVVALAAAGLLASVLASLSDVIRTNLSRRDSIAYWAAGQLLAHHQNPYSVVTVLELERSQGYAETKPLVLRTPPWSLFMVLPLGLVGPFPAWVAWITASITSLVLVVRFCWNMYGRDGRPPAIYVMVAYTFAPVPACLVAGQMGLVLLLGLVLFLWLEPDHPFLAGAALVIPFAKPHLLALFWAVFFLWALIGRRRALLTGFFSTLAATTVIALAFDPAIFQHYRETIHQASIGNEFIPAFSGVVRLLFFHRLFWMQFVPMAIGLIWSLWFYCRNRAHWDWRHHGLALFIVSVLTTPYAWLTDEVVLLPAVLQASLWVYFAKRSLTAIDHILVALFACLNVLLLLILRAKVPFATGIYFWSSLVWFGWYLFAWRFHPSKIQQSPPTVGLH
jgi:hypothetical protein